MVKIISCDFSFKYVSSLINLLVLTLILAKYLSNVKIVRSSLQL